MNKRYTFISSSDQRSLLFSYKLTFSSLTKHFHKSIFVFLKKCFIKKIYSKFKSITANFPSKIVKFSPDKFSPLQDKNGSVLLGWSLKVAGGPLVIKDRHLFAGPFVSLLSSTNTELLHFWKQGFSHIKLSVLFSL